MVRVVWNERVDDGIHSVVRTTLRSAQTGTWSEPAEAYRTSASQGVACVQLVVDVAGNATASCAANSDTSTSTFVLRYTAAVDTWTPEDIATGTGLPFPHLAMDAAGNTSAVWSATTLRVRRHTASTNTWGPVEDLPFVGIGPILTADAGGNLFLLWRDAERATIYGAHNEAATGRWSGAAAIRIPNNIVGPVEVALDGTGHAMVVWAPVNSSSVVRAARYAASTASWGPVIDLAAGGAVFSEAQVVADAEGNALAVWRARYDSQRSQIEAALYVASTGTWSAAAIVSAAQHIPDGPEVVADAVGNVTIVWQAASETDNVLRAVRYKKATGTLGAPVDIAPARAMRAPVVSDRFGSVTLVWHLQAARWEAAPAAPAIISASAAAGVLRVSGTAPPTIEPDFLPTNYEYSTDDGATWTPRAPASTTSPLEIVGLAGGTTYQVRVRAVNPAGPGAASAAVPVTLAAAPSSPSNLAVTAIVGSQVTVAWSPPTGGTPPEGYVLEGGLQPGEVLAMLPTGSSLPIFTFVAPSGAFYVRIRAYAGASWSAASNELRIYINAPVPPSAPAYLLSLVSGSTVALSWTNTLTGGAPTSLRLNVSGAWTGPLPLPMGEAFTLAAVPTGTYTLSVIAVNAAGESAPSNAVTMTVPGACGSGPEAPRNFVARASGRTIYVAWDAPASGAAVTDYAVLVTGDYVGSFRTMVRSLASPAPPGSYTLSVVAANPCGKSAPTPARTITIS
jgi:hypothetical protein